MMSKSLFITVFAATLLLVRGGCDYFLHIAAVTGKTDKVRELLDHGACTEGKLGICGYRWRTGPMSMLRA